MLRFYEGGIEAGETHNHLHLNLAASEKTYIMPLKIVKRQEQMRLYFR